MSGTRYAFASFFLGCALLPATAGAQDARPGIRVHVIDVGQGSATLVELPKGSILIDTGGEYNGAAFDGRKALNAYLDAFFDRRTDLGGRLDLLVVTHPHPDHVLGMRPARWYQTSLRPVLATYRPRHVVHNGQPPVARWVEDYLEVEAGAREEVVAVAALPAGAGLAGATVDPFGDDGDQDPGVQVFWGRVDDESGWCPADVEDPNNHSVVVRVDYGAASLLVTGDLESTDTYKCGTGKMAGIERLLARYDGTALLDVDLYLAGHHGSHNGTTAALVAATSPKVAVISAGPAIDRGDYTAADHGHPREVTVAALETGVRLCRDEKAVRTFEFHRQKPPHERTIERAVFSTGWDGTVVLFGDETGFWTLGRPAGSLRSCAGG